MTERLHPKRILILDDDPSVQHLIGMVLRRQGFSVAIANCPADAEARMTQESFEVLVTDHDMPRENGLSFVKRIRTGTTQALRTNRNIPVVMVSGNSEPKYLEDVEQAGIRAFVQKPFRPIAFAKLVKRVADGDDLGGFVHLHPHN